VIGGATPLWEWIGDDGATRAHAHVRRERAREPAEIPLGERGLSY
jgi:hypothetical protein